MALFYTGPADFDSVRREYEDCLKRFKPELIQRNKGGKGNPLAFYNSRAYKLFTASVYKAIRSLETGKNKEYAKYIFDSKGDYSKRKGGNVAAQLASHAAFLEDFLKKSGSRNLRYSLLGIFTDIWGILKNPKWTAAFKRAFSHADKTGKTNTIASSFAMIYAALAIVFEAAGIKMLSVEYDIYAGIPAEQAVLNIMKTHPAFMKSAAMPMIRVICVCLNISDPVKMVNEAIADEEAVKKAKKQAREAGYPYKSEENGLSAMEAHKIEQMDNAARSRESKSGIMETLGMAASAITGVKAAGVAAGATAAIYGVPVSAAAAVLILCASIVILLMCAVPVARMAIYWASVRKVDIQKELELQAELLNNNILSLQEKLEKAGSEEERAKIQNIINKQVEMLVRLQGQVKKYLDEEYEASIDAVKEAEGGDPAASEEPGDGDESGDGDGNFEVAI